MGRHSVTTKPEDLPITHYLSLISLSRAKANRNYRQLKQIQFLIAATSSGSGKTTVSLGLLRAFARRGLRVQPFKCGPDYIDTKHHTLAAGTESVNLDLFLASSSHVQSVFDTHTSDADIALIEGVMGLFDGAKKMEGSSAQIAELLDLPVILIVNGKATAYSVAPLLYGFKNFHKGIRIAGVIFNFVNTKSHYSFLEEAALDVGVTPLGYLPKNEKLAISSRHLGLDISSQTDFESIVNSAADHIEEHIDMDLLSEICSVEKPKSEIQNISSKEQSNSQIIAVARDEAFNFAYVENLKALEQMGQIVYFSPLEDEQLPQADMVYLAGGYPELYVKQLSDNTSMLSSIRDYAESGGKILAECGGMMYLCKSMIAQDDVEYPLVGVFDQVASMQNMKLHLGYRKLKYKGEEFRGHEFHYSSIIENSDYVDSEAEFYSARDRKQSTALYRKNNVVATYVHFYWAENPELFFSII